MKLNSAMTMTAVCCAALAATELATASTLSRPQCRLYDDPCRKEALRLGPNGDAPRTPMMESSVVVQGVLEKRVPRRDVEPHPRWVESLTEIYGTERLQEMLGYRTWTTMYHYLRVTKLHRQDPGSTVNVGDLITIEVGGLAPDQACSARVAAS